MKDTRKIFLPLTLDSSTKQLFSGKQLLGFCVFFLLLVFWQVAILKIRDSFSLPVWLILLIDFVGVWFLVFLLRKIVLKENQMMRQYQQHQNLQKTDLGFIWNIFNIHDGHIYYCNGMQAVVIQLTHGYLLDRPPDQEQTHRDAVNIAIGNIAKQGYKFVYLNRESKESNLEPLMRTEHQLYQYKNSSIYETASKIIQHTFNMCSSIANTEQEYYVIFADTMDTVKKLDHAAAEFLNALHGGIYVQKKVLSDDEIWAFIADLYGVSYINTAALLSQKFENNQLPLVRIIDVMRTDDYVEEPIETPSSSAQEVHSVPVAYQSEQENVQDSDEDEGDFL